MSAVSSGLAMPGRGRPLTPVTGSSPREVGGTRRGGRGGRGVSGGAAPGAVRAPDPVRFDGADAFAAAASQENVWEFG